MKGLRLFLIAGIVFVIFGAIGIGTDIGRYYNTDNNARRDTGILRRG